MRPQTLLVIILVAALGLRLSAQDGAVTVQPPRGPFFLRPYRATSTTTPKLTNSERIHTLIRGGNLYLTVQDAIALAIENNLDLEVDRYGPVLADWGLQRAQSGGALRGVPSGSSQIATVASGQGITGSQQAAGLSNTTTGGSGNSGGAAVAQIGPVTQNLDPVFQNTSLYSHHTIPQANTLQSQVDALVQVSHEYSTTLQQGLLTGGYVQLYQRESYLKENTPTDVLNPSEAPLAGVYIQHNLLNSFGVGVNSRFIRVATANAAASRDTFRSQLLDLAANVLSSYWSLVADNDSFKARQSALDTADKFYRDTKTEIEIGALSRVDIYRAQAEVATRKQELSIAQVQLDQQETLLKQLISRGGDADPTLERAHIIPLDSIEVPETDDIPPRRELLKIALAKRPDVAAANTRMSNANISALGTANGIRPELIGFARTYNTGLSGVPQVVAGEQANPYFVGGIGNAFAQVGRRDFPNESGGAYFQINVHNRISQGDYGVEQLQLRQTQVTTERQLNQIFVDISNQVVALRQARARYAAALDTRKLQQQLLELEQRKFSLGTATFNDLIGVQRSLVAAQTSEFIALGTYALARVGLDQSLGVTLEKNKISVEDARNGQAVFTR